MVAKGRVYDKKGVWYSEVTKTTHAMVGKRTSDETESKGMLSKKEDGKSL